MNKSHIGWWGFVLALITASAIFNTLIFQLYSDQRARALADADRDLIARAQFLSDAVVRTLNARLIQTFTFAALPSVRGFAASDQTQRVTRGAVVREELRALVAADDNIRAASIVDAFGIVQMTTDASILADWSDRAFVRDALRGHLHASVPARDFGELVQYYSAPILNNAGDVAGALVLRVAAQELWAALGTYPNVLLVDEDGVRIGDRTDKPQLYTALVPLSGDQMTRVYAQKRYGAEITQIRATNQVELRDAITRGAPTPFEFRDADGKTKRAAMTRVRLNFWTVVAFANEDEIYSFSRTAFRDLILVAAATLAIGLTLGFILGKYLLRAPEANRDAP